MKSLQVVAHTTGGEVKSAVEQVTEREFEAMKESFKEMIHSGLGLLELNTDEGWVIIPAAQLLYVEIKVF